MTFYLTYLMFFASITLLIIITTEVEATNFFNVKIEPENYECFSEVLAAGEAISVMFHVINDNYDGIDAALQVSFTPPIKDVTHLSQMQFNDYVIGLRDRKVSQILMEWTHVKQGKKFFNAMSAEESMHGLPTEITICFNNTFKTKMPKWIAFSFSKKETLLLNNINSSTNSVESEMSSRLHHFSEIIYDLQHDIKSLQITGANDRRKIDSLKNLAYSSIIANVTILLIMCIYQYTVIAKQLNKQMYVYDLK